MDWVHGHWGVPGGSMLTILVRNSLGGTPIKRWFTLVDVQKAGLHPRYAWSERTLRWAGSLAGVTIPSPEYVSVADPLPIVRWMSRLLQSGQTPCLHGYVSSVARLCDAALAADIDLRGARFWLGGEPITAGRLASVERVGAQFVGFYGSTEAGNLGRTCLSPEAPDDLHFSSDRLALIQPGEGTATGLPSRALLLTSLLPTARLILLNVSLGDQ